MNIKNLKKKIVRKMFVNSFPVKITRSCTGIGKTNLIKKILYFEKSNFNQNREFKGIRTIKRVYNIIV